MSLKSHSFRKPAFHVVLSAEAQLRLAERAEREKRDRVRRTERRQAASRKAIELEAQP